MSVVTTYYLEMRSPHQLKEKRDAQEMILTECEIKQFQVNRFLYEFVGTAWNWTDKLSWTDEQWKNYAEADNLRTWIASVKGSPAGYFELQQQADGNVEIAYFGLAPNFIGQGMGGYLLSQAIKMAWSWKNTQRVWVHTCSFDHSSALKNYQSRGLTLYHTEETVLEP